MSAIFPLSGYTVKETVTTTLQLNENNGTYEASEEPYVFLMKTDGNDKLWSYHGDIVNGKAHGNGVLYVYGVDNQMIHEYSGIFINNQLYTDGLEVKVRRNVKGLDCQYGFDRDEFKCNDITYYKDARNVINSVRFDD